jgi:VWFA-related protein
MESRLARMTAVAACLLALGFFAAAQQQTAGSRRLLAMYFDVSGATAGERANALAAAAKFIHTSVKPDDAVAIMTFARGTVAVKQDFTGDMAQAVKALDQLAATDELGAGAVPIGDDRAASLIDVLQRLGKLTERKSLLYFSSGLPSLNDSKLQSAIQSATKGNIAVFPIDVRGLVVQPAR